jgi:glycogen operon protein
MQSLLKDWPFGNPAGNADAGVIVKKITVSPTHSYQAYKVRLGHPSGRPYPSGATVVPWGINFSIFSKHATSCVLVLFNKGEAKPFIEIPFISDKFEDLETNKFVKCKFQIGNIFTMTVFDLDYKNIEYGFRMERDKPEEKKGLPRLHRFDPSKILLDPYAKAIGGRDVWGSPNPPDRTDCYPHRARIVGEDFDWGTDHPLEIPMEDLIIYEMHVRGFTGHPTAQVKTIPGTFAALQEKIPYLKGLGINCVELMPIFEFDELDNVNTNPETGQSLMNYWGYNTIGFFAPKAGYAAAGKTKDGTLVANELKTLIKELHKNGIEVFLDVVFNHTSEGNEQGPTISFRGIDNVTYYMLTPDGRYQNFSGTGNTLNCNNPIVRNLVLEALRHWVTEYHIDGFRFDLASILGRDPTGEPMENPPLLELLSFDPTLGRCKLIAEAWDAGGLYQVGSFPDYGRWAEWNGKYRDDLRQFLRGDEKKAGLVAQRLQGSPDLYSGRGAIASINFITCHDGFTLADWVSYQQKHNQANGENNKDGSNENHSCNWGYEGPTIDPKIKTLRLRQMKNAIAILMVSQGVPMILMGDEVGRSQKGNNNAYCHDNEHSWLDWELKKKNGEVFRFIRNCIAFRQAHPVLRNREHFRHQDYQGSGYPDISWHGVQLHKPDWAPYSHSLAFMLCGRHAKEGTVEDDYIYVAINMYWETLKFELPKLPTDLKWHIFTNTNLPSPKDNHLPGNEPRLSEQQHIPVGARAMVILVGR